MLFQAGINKRRTVVQIEFAAKGTDGVALRDEIGFENLLAGSVVMFQEEKAPLGPWVMSDSFVTQRLYLPATAEDDLSNLVAFVLRFLESDEVEVRVSGVQ